MTTITRAFLFRLLSSLRIGLVALRCAACIAAPALAGVETHEMPRGPGLLHAAPQISGMSPYDYYRCKRSVLQPGVTAPDDSCLEKAAAAYPFDGEVWHRLALRRLAAGDASGAKHAFERALAFGVAHYGEEDAADLARLNAKTRDLEAACHWLKVAIYGLNYRDPDGLVGEPVFNEVRRGRTCFRGLARASSGSSRRDDTDYFVRAVETYRPDLKPSQRERLRSAAAAIGRGSNGRSLDEFAVQLQRLHALVGRGHSGSPVMWEEKGLGSRGLKVLPVDFYLFPEGLFVIGENGSDQSLVGAQVMAFDSIPARTAIERVASLIDRDPGSEMSVVWLGPRFLAMPAVLKVLGLSSSVTQAKLTLRLKDGAERTIILSGGKFRPRPKLYPPSTAPATNVPLYLQRVAEPFWSTALDPATIYFQFNQVANSKQQTLTEFALELRKTLNAGTVRNLIVDMRHNNGGDTYIYPELLRTLIAFDTVEGHRIFMISGRNTFSAAQNFLVDVNRLTHAVFVGEPASAPRAGGDEVTFHLPSTGLPAGTAPVLWSLQSPADTRIWIAPDLPVVLTAADYFANRDPVLEAIQRVIAQRDRNAVPVRF